MGSVWPCEGVRAPSMRRCSASSSVGRRGPAGGSGQGHAATWERCAHMLVPVGVAKNTVLESPRRVGRCARGWRLRTRGRGGRARGRPTLGEGGLGVPAGGRGHGAGGPYRVFPADCLPSVVGEYSVVLEGRYEVTGGAPGGPSYRCDAP